MVRMKFDFQSATSLIHDLWFAHTNLETFKGLCLRVNQPTTPPHLFLLLLLDEAFPRVIS
jgi:hypothetical protein